MFFGIKFISIHIFNYVIALGKKTAPILTKKFLLVSKSARDDQNASGRSSE